MRGGHLSIALGWRATPLVRLGPPIPPRGLEEFLIWNGLRASLTRRSSESLRAKLPSELPLTHRRAVARSEFGPLFGNQSQAQPSSRVDTDPRSCSWPRPDTNGALQHRAPSTDTNE